MPKWILLWRAKPLCWVNCLPTIKQFNWIIQYTGYMYLLIINYHDFILHNYFDDFPVTLSLASKMVLFSQPMLTTFFTPQIFVELSKPSPYIDHSVHLTLNWHWTFDPDFELWPWPQNRTATSIWDYKTWYVTIWFWHMTHYLDLQSQAT